MFPVWDDVTVTEISDRDVVGTTGWRQSWRQPGGAWWRHELPHLVVQQQDGEARAASFSWILLDVATVWQQHGGAAEQQ